MDGHQFRVINQKRAVIFVPSSLLIRVYKGIFYNLLLFRLIKR